jgi:hypothetical protein
MSTWSETAFVDVDLRPRRPRLLPVDGIGKAPGEVVVGMDDPRRLTDWSPNVEVSGR